MRVFVKEKSTIGIKKKIAGGAAMFRGRLDHLWRRGPMCPGARNCDTRLSSAAAGFAVYCVYETDVFGHFYNFSLTELVKNGTKFVNMGTKKIPESTISRLFIYLREVAMLANMNIRTISSSELGERVNLNDAQVRKDLGHFGQFGVSGSGYDTQELKAALEKILGKDKTWNVAVVGAGHLGSALLAYPGFEKYSLNLVAAFDADVKKIGKNISGVKISPIEDMPGVIRNRRVSIGVVAVPAEGAQEVADRLIAAGVECILNFAPASLNVPENVKVKDVDLSRELETLSYFLADKR